MEYVLNRSQSKGWQRDPPARLHPNILFGSGEALTQGFVIKENISHVINCASDNDSPEWFRESYPTRYACINAIDSVDANITEWYPEFSRIMNTFLKDRDSRVIYVHCQCGINRSGFLALLFVCMRFGYPITNTIQSIVKQRGCALSNPSFKKQVAEYIKKHR